MATKGAKYIKWAAISTEADNALPTYSTAVSLGALSKVTDTPAMNEAKLYGDDKLAEYVSEFKECAIDVELTELSNDIAEKIFGATVSSGEATFKANDVAPYGGLAYVVAGQKNNVNFYQGIFYPKTKATMQGEEYTSKGDTVTLTGKKAHFVAVACNNEAWKVKSEEFTTLSSATGWVDSML